VIRTFGVRDGRLVRLHVTLQGLPTCPGIVWVDLCNPTPDEEKCVEKILRIAVPTRQEMAEIEESARLYEERGALVMTAVVISGVAEGMPSRTQVTFVLTKTHLVSVRYADPLPFRNFEAKCERQANLLTSSDRIVASLLESIVERAADVLEAVAADLNDVANRLFIEDADRGGPRKAKREENELQALIKRLGRRNIMLSILRESLLSMSRLIPFLREGAREWLTNGNPGRLKQIDRDLRSLAAYEAQLSSEIVYLHEATLGLINLDQNRIIKVFSVAAVLFLPPTVVGTIYGMNFEVMPELKWQYGYAFALVLMVISAAVPYYWFKRRGWL
jgi:magnesium transporter